MAEILTQPPAAWSAFRPGAPTSFGFTEDVFWLRLRLKAVPIFSGEVVVVLDNSRMERVDWFALRNGEVSERELNGNQRPPMGRCQGQRCRASG